jgi:hypothetical protein
VLIQIVLVQPRNGGFEDVRGRYGTAGFPPSPGVRVVVQGGLGLGAGQAELPGVERVPRGRVVA